MADTEEEQEVPQIIIQEHPSGLGTFALYRIDNNSDLACGVCGGRALVMVTVDDAGSLLPICEYDLAQSYGT